MCSMSTGSTRVKPGWRRSALRPLFLKMNWLKSIKILAVVIDCRLNLGMFGYGVSTKPNRYFSNE